MFHKIVFSFALIIAGLLTYPTMGMAQDKKAVPVIAERQVISYSADDEQSETLEKYYRDQEGRIRIEQQNLITISDPISRTTTVLDSTTKTFNKIQWTQNVVAANTTESQQNDISTPLKKRKVGSQTIEGIEAIGEEITNIIPVEGNQKTIRGVTTIWASKKMQILVQHSYKDSLGNSITSSLKNIKVGVNPDASLFEVPTDYVSVAEGYNRAESKIQPNAVCPLYISYTINGFKNTLNSTPATVYIIQNQHVFVEATAYSCANLNYNATYHFTTSGPLSRARVIFPGPSNTYDGVDFADGGFSNTDYATGGVYFYKTNNSNPHLVNIILTY